MRVLDIPLKQLLPDPHQPRRTFSTEEIMELAESIKSQELQQLPVVNFAYTEEGLEYYYIKAGERRFRAHLLLGLTSMNCVVEDAVYNAEYSVGRRLAQAAENSSRVPHTHSEIVTIVEEVVQDEINKRGGEPHGAIRAALLRVSTAFGKSFKWAESYYTLTRLHIGLRVLLDKQDEERLNFGIACALARAPDEKQHALYARAKEQKGKGGYSAMYRYVVRESRALQVEAGTPMRKRNPSEERSILVNLVRTVYRSTLAFYDDRTTGGQKRFLASLIEGMELTDLADLHHKLAEVRINLDQIETALKERRETLSKGLYVVKG